MITINRNGTSSVVFRLNKVSQYSQPYYIFVATNQNSKIETIFNSDDLSIAPDYYNEFDFVNGASFSATQSRFDLDAGMYFMDIYETDIQFLLNPASASLLYQGEMKVDGPINPATIYYDNDNKIKYFE